MVLRWCECSLLTSRQVIIKNAKNYLPPFAACVAAGVEQVMCSYNAVNGVPTCLDGGAINGVLRSGLGFDGMVVSDCGAIEDAWQPKPAHGQGFPCSWASGVPLGFPGVQRRLLLDPHATYQGSSRLCQGSNLDPWTPAGKTLRHHGFAPNMSDAVGGAITAGADQNCGIDYGGAAVDGALAAGTLSLAGLDRT
jgi:hypothetical protein